MQPEIFTVLSVDPTFNLGSFHVTLSTYRHPMLQYRHGRKREQPVMFGPLFIHQCKNFATYNFFFSQLVGLRPSLKDLRCFALENALHTQFKLALHSRCFLHFRGNLENKLSELGISKANAQEFIKDVFDNPALLEDGLVDAEASELDQEFSNLKPVWDNREIVLSGQSQAHLHGWFKKNCLEVVRKNMLKETCEQAGLGSPPEPFYTNDVESKNRVLKQQTEYKPQELPAFVESIKNLFEEQKLEIEKAVIGSGEFKLLPKYRDLEVQQMEWYKKTDKQRLRVLERFNCAPLRGLTPKIGEREQAHQRSDESSNPTTETPSDQVSEPSTSNPLGSSDIPLGIQVPMWSKVQKYLEDKSSYTKAPGVKDYLSILVKSSSTNRPHFVERTGDAKYRCNKECLMFKSHNGMCSHCLLLAVLNGEVDRFVRNYSRTKDPINYMQLGQHGLPVGGK